MHDFGGFGRIALHPTKVALLIAGKVLPQLRVKMRNMMPTAETLQKFIARIEENAHAEAIEAFYTADASMQENQSERTSTGH